MYILEGNIGAGKSTFLKMVEERVDGISVGYEPLADWQREIYGQSLLNNFYGEPERWAYSMETFSMLSRVRDHLSDQKRPEPFRIIERSIYSGHYCFALNSYRSGFLSPLEWDMYNAWFNFLIPDYCKPPRGFLYLRVKPTIAFQRLRKRARSAEATVPLDYLEQLARCHDDFLIKKEGVLPELKEVPVLVLDCEDDFEEDPTCFTELVDKVRAFLIDTTPDNTVVPHEESVHAS